MHEPPHATTHISDADATLAARNAPRIPIVPLGMALGGLLALTFVLCVLFDLWLPSQAMSSVWETLLPGFTWISWGSFLLGLVETFAYGWYIALIFAPIFNFFAARSFQSTAS